MKKIIFIVTAMTIVITSCSGDKHSSKLEIRDSQELEDSINMGESTTRTVDDSFKEDSLITAEAGKQFKNALTMKKGKESKKWIGDTTDPNISVPVTIHNNTDIPIKGSDYSIAYTYGYTDGVDEDGDGCDDYIDFFNKKAKKKGVDIAPRSSVTITIFEKTVTDISNIKLKNNLTKNEFEKRFREHRNMK